MKRRGPKSSKDSRTSLVFQRDLASMLKTELKRVTKERDRFYEALNSIASKHKPQHAKEEYWLKVSHEQCATVLATDTKIARNALKRAAASQAKPE